MQITRTHVTIVLFLSIQCFINCKESSSPKLPPEDRFRKVVIAEGTKELQGAIQFDFAPDGRIYIIDLVGYLKIFNPQTKSFIKAAKFDGGEYGLIGMKLDPDFNRNAYIYLQYFIADTTRYADSISRRIMKISRFTMQGDTLHKATEKNYLQIPYEYECCHTGGGMDFDTKGNLYISTGDNTGAFFSQYSPTAILPGHLIDDGLRSSGNTNDYRGKILRIHPESDGNYTIPEGNLFAEGTAKTKPEIYIMGLRNPYRLTIDKRSGYLLWGEVGPDAGRDSSYGPRGYDEFNQARKAGNFGWPLIIANNKAYTHVIYGENQTPENNMPVNRVAEKFDTAHPVNFSPNNTGLRDLPPAQPAFIWYPYDSSKTFPSFGAGGRTAIGGPVYTFDPALDSKIKFPDYFDHCWFIGDWMRDWVKVVHFNKNNDLLRVDDFLPGTKFTKPIYIKFGPDGALYMLEYGTTWASNNADIKLSRIEYIPGNRPPVAQIQIGKKTGKDQLTIPLSADSSFDYDGDALRYTWKDHKGNITGKDKSFSAVYDEPGRYGIRLEVADGNGNVTVKDSFVTAGVTTEVALQLPNRSFYWDTIQYALSVKNEKKEIAAAENAKVFLQYLPAGSNPRLTGANADINGEVLMNESDCKGCHHHDLTSVGPSFMQIADRYSTQPEMIAPLASKILKGGSGMWGGNNMSAHPQLSVEQATAIVRYIYSLSEKQNPVKELPAKGRVAVAAAGKTQAQSGRYKLKGNYTSNAPPFRGLIFSDSSILRNALVRGADFDRISDATISDGIITGRTFSFAYLKDIDLSGIRKIKIWSSGPIEIRIDSEKGPVIGKAHISNSKSLQSVTTDLQPTHGSHDIYFVFSVAEDGFVLQQRLQQVFFIAPTLSGY